MISLPYFISVWYPYFHFFKKQATPRHQRQKSRSRCLDLPKGRKAKQLLQRERRIVRSGKGQQQPSVHAAGQNLPAALDRPQKTLASYRRCCRVYRQPLRRCRSGIRSSPRRIRPMGAVMLREKRRRRCSPVTLRLRDADSQCPALSHGHAHHSPSRRTQLISSTVSDARRFHPSAPLRSPLPPEPDTCP